MKKLSILLFAFVAFTGLNSCSSDDDVVFIAQPDPEGISFTNSFNQTYILTPGTGTNVAERFVWNTVNFSTPTNITYEVQGSTDANFASFDVLGTTGSNNFAVTVNQMRSLAQDAGMDNDPATEAPNTGSIYFRVQAYAGTGGGTNLVETSEVVSITVVLPEAEVEEEEEFINLFLVGSATATGWDNNPTGSTNNYPLFRDGENENLYHYTGKFTGGADMFWKLIEVKGQWAPQYGGQNGTLVYRAADADPDPAAIPVSADGYYTVTVNTADLTYTMTSFNASAVPTFATIGVIGNATTGNDDGWGVDIDMTKSSFDPHIWFLRGIELKEAGGEVAKIKFRSDDSWDVNWGGPTFPSGQATQNGPDIETPAGKYDIWFNDITKRYILIPVE
ncbi:hypothetical protein BH23BAC2_BH23BAC2_21600 [soil metagenome]